MNATPAVAAAAWVGITLASDDLLSEVGEVLRSRRDLTTPVTQNRCDDGVVVSGQGCSRVPVHSLDRESELSLLFDTHASS